MEGAVLAGEGGMDLDRRLCGLGTAMYDKARDRVGELPIEVEV